MQARTPTRTSLPATALPTAADVAFAATVVALTAATAAIHAYLGGLLFLANAAGYTTLAIALIAPISLARRYRWLVRLALLGFTLATMAGWLIFGARIPLAYLDKGLEALLVACSWSRCTASTAVRSKRREAWPAWRRTSSAASPAGQPDEDGTPLRALALAGALASALLVGGCSSPAPVTTPEVAGGVPLVASGTAFVQTNVAVPADKPFKLVFENRDGAPHNVSISAPDGRAQVFVGETINGPAATVYSVQALPAGAYTFRCDVHPEMKGTLVSS